MAIGVTGWSLDGSGGACLKTAAAAGFDAIQIGINGPADCRGLSSERWKEEIREASRIHRIPVAALALNVLERWGIGESSSDAARRRAVALVRTAARAAREFGASVVYVPSFGRNRMMDRRSIDRTARFLRLACRVAGDLGLTLASENTLSLAGNLLLVEAVHDPVFRILIDTYNPLLGGYDASELIRGLRTYLCHQAHLKDGSDGVMGSAPLGSGEGRVADALSAFSEVGYTGTFFLENDYRGARMPRAAADIRFMRERASMPAEDARMRTSGGGVRGSGD